MKSHGFVVDLPDFPILNHTQKINAPEGERLAPAQLRETLVSTLHELTLSKRNLPLYESHIVSILNNQNFSKDGLLQVQYIKMSGDLKLFVDYINALKQFLLQANLEEIAAIPFANRKDFYLLEKKLNEAQQLGILPVVASRLDIDVSPLLDVIVQKNQAFDTTLKSIFDSLYLDLMLLPARPLAKVELQKMTDMFAYFYKHHAETVDGIKSVLIDDALANQLQPFYDAHPAQSQYSFAEVKTVFEQMNLYLRINAKINALENQQHFDNLPDKQVDDFKLALRHLLDHKENLFAINGNVLQVSKLANGMLAAIKEKQLMDRLQLLCDQRMAELSKIQATHLHQFEKYSLGKSGFRYNIKSEKIKFNDAMRELRLVRQLQEILQSSSAIPEKIADFHELFNHHRAMFSESHDRATKKFQSDINLVFSLLNKETGMFFNKSLNGQERLMGKENIPQYHHK